VHARWLYDTLMQRSATTFTEFAVDLRRLGGIGAFTLVLHTWTLPWRRGTLCTSLGCAGEHSRSRPRRDRGAHIAGRA
jgi:hypothetical protein